ncbi:hypothetical protein MHM92_06330 [Caballeronia zhejiangensis]|nr:MULTISPECIES: hypothetical protein [Caballeronia]MCG7400414.1 hypothetical protein [Caballeronia zhejiangensis]
MTRDTRRRLSAGGPDRRHKLNEFEQAMQSVAFSAEPVDLRFSAAFDNLSFVERAIPDDRNRGEAGRFTDGRSHRESITDWHLNV